MKKPEVMWAFWANMFGPWNLKPRHVKYNGDTWWAKDGNSEAKQIGLYENEGYLCFADPDKQKVQQFIDGYMACRRQIAVFANGVE